MNNIRKQNRTLNCRLSSCYKQPENKKCFMIQLECWLKIQLDARVNTWSIVTREHSTTLIFALTSLENNKFSHRAFSLVSFWLENRESSESRKRSWKILDGFHESLVNKPWNIVHSSYDSSYILSHFSSVFLLLLLYRIYIRIASFSVSWQIALKPSSSELYLAHFRALSLALLHLLPIQLPSNGPEMA